MWIWLNSLYEQNDQPGNNDHPITLIIGWQLSFYN